MRRFFTFLNSSGFKASLTAMKRHMHPIVIVLLVVVFSNNLMIDACAADFTVNNINYTILDATAKTCKTDESSNAIGSVIIPSTVTYKGTAYKVVEIGDHSFYQNTRITSITLPEGITKIGEYAIHHTGVAELYVPSSVTDLAPGALSSNEECLSIAGMQNVKTVGSECFSGCFKITSINLPSVETIGYHSNSPTRVFGECKALKSITLGSSLKSVVSLVEDTYGVLIRCDALTPPTYLYPARQSGTEKRCTLIVPESSASRYRTADGWKDYGKINPVFVSSIGLSATETTVYIGDKITINPSVLPANAEDQSVSWSSSNSSIAQVDANGVVTGRSAGTVTITATANDFSGVKGTINITVKAVLPTSIKLADGETSLNMEVGDTYQLKTPTIEPANTSDKTIKWTSSDETVATVSNGVITAFGAGTARITAQCSNVMAQSTITVTEPSKTPEISKTSFTVGNINYTILNRTTCKTTQSPNVTGKLTIPSNVTYGGIQYSVIEIGSHSFYENTKITSVELPNTLTSIGEYGIYNLGFYNIEIPSSVKNLAPRALAENRNCNRIIGMANVETVGDDCFSGCLKLEEISLPSVKVVGTTTRVFGGCTALKIIRLGNKTESVCCLVDDVGGGSPLLVYCDAQTPPLYTGGWDDSAEAARSTLMVPESSADLYRKADRWKNFGWINPVLVSDINFDSPTYSLRVSEQLQLSPIVTPSNAGNKTMLWSSSKTYIATVDSNGVVTGVGTGTTTITVMAADGYTVQKSIEITVESNIVEVSGLYYELDIPTRQAELIWDRYTFYETLTQVSIPETVEYNGQSYTVTSVGDGAFGGCQNLNSVKVADSVIAIGNNAFRECSNLKSIELPNSVNKLGYSAFYGCGSLETIKIPSCVTELGTYIFQQSRALNKIYYFSKEPIDCEEYVFYDSDYDYDICSQAKLYVLPGVKSKIITSKSAWSLFDTNKGVKNNNIIEVSFGDFDLDGTVRIEDAIKVANYAVGNEISGDFIEELADVNGDDSVTISDAVGTVSVVLSQSSSTSMAKVSGMSDAEITDFLVAEDPIANGGNMSRMDVSLDSSVGYVALQADVYVPEGMKLESVTNGSRALSHTVMHREVGENIYRVVVFNFDGVEFDDAPGSLFTLNFSSEGAESGDIQLINIHASDANGKGYRLGVQNGSTGVGSLNGDKISIVTEGGRILINGAEGRNVAVYSTDGRLVGRNIADNESIAVTAGIYIVSIDGKTSKIVVK